MGYKTFLVKEKQGEVSVTATVTTQKAENEFYSITANANGSLNITDKQTNVTYNNVLTIEDGSDDGDEYDFSPLEDDFVLSSDNVDADVTMQTMGDKTVIVSSFTMPVPKDLDSRKAKVIDGEIDVKLKVTLRAKSKMIDIKVTIANKAKDHRVRLLVPNGIATNYSISDNQFGSIKRLVVDEAMAVWEQEKWDERPDSIYPMLSYVTTDTQNGLAVLTNSVREYELIGDGFGTIAVTLFRGVGVLGKENLFRRPGRPSGIKLETPDSQLLTTLNFDLALVAKDEHIAKNAKEYLTPFVYYNKMPYNAMKLNDAEFNTPYEYSMFEIKGDDFVLSTLKKAEKQDGLILRAYQSSLDSANVDFNSEYLSVKHETNLNEVKCNDDTNITLPINTVKSYFML